VSHEVPDEGTKKSSGPGGQYHIGSRRGRTIRAAYPCSLGAGLDPRLRPFIVSVAVIRVDSMGIPALRQGRMGT
jgi:hypothetical protein